MNEFVIKHGFISKGDSIVNGTISGDTLNLTSIPDLNLSATEILVRNSTTGIIERTTVGSIVSGDTFVTGFTYDDINTFTISDNSGSTFNASINVLSATTISGGTLYGDGSNLTGIGVTFTGNTSGDCISDLWVTNISGCSPVTIGTEAIFNQDVSGTTSIWTTPNPGGGSVNLMTPALIISQLGSSQNYSGPAIQLHDPSSNDGAYLFYQDGGSGAATSNGFNFISDGGFNFQGGGDLATSVFFNITKGQSSLTIDDNASAPRTDVKIHNGNGGIAYSRLGLGATGDYWYFEADDVNTPMHIGWDDGVTEKNVFTFTTDSGIIDTPLFITSGITTNQDLLTVSGRTRTINFQMMSGATDGYILTSDAVGNSSWQPSINGNTFTTGFTYDNNNTFTINDNVGSAFTATINQVSGLTVNGTLSATTLDGNTILSGGTNLLTIIDDRDTFVTGTTFGGNQAILRRNDGTSVFELSGSSTVQLTNPSGNKIDIDVTIPTDNNTFITAFTYDDINAFTITDNVGTAFTASINILSAATISGGTLYGDGSNLTGIGVTFTGNTSGDCITDLYLTNLHGCSPITFNSSIQHIGSSATGLNSIAWGSGNTSSDNFSSILGGQINSITGNSTGCENNTIVGGSNNTMSGFVSANSDNNTILGGLSNNITARSIRSTIIGGDSNIIGVSGGTTVNAVIVGGTGNVFPGLTSATNSVIVGGTGITGSSANTAYVPNLNIGTLGNGTPSYHLGIDSNGFVVTAATGGSSATCINELWVSTISGCSPVTIGPEVIIEESLTVGSGAQKWDNGYLGNDEFIALMPSDFMHREDGRGIPVDDAWISDSGGTMTVSAIGDFWVAMKIIPKGFECNGASVNTESLVTGGVSILYGDITTSTVTTILASQDTNTSITFSPPVVGTGTEYIIIRYEPDFGLSPLRGGKIDIQRT